MISLNTSAVLRTSTAASSRSAPPAGPARHPLPGMSGRPRWPAACQAPGVAMPPQQRRLAVHPVPPQLRRPPRRYPRHVQGVHPQGSDLLDRLQRPLQLGPGDPHPTGGSRSSSDIRAPGSTVSRESCTARLPVHGRLERGCSTAAGSPTPARRRPGRHRHSGQQHTPLTQPPHRRVEQRLRPGPRPSPWPGRGQLNARGGRRPDSIDYPGPDHVPQFLREPITAAHGHVGSPLPYRARRPVRVRVAS